MQASHVHPGGSGCRGFTLVELLVVIAIISVLISILLPVLAKARDGAKAIKCAVNIRSIFTMSEMYRQDNRMFYMPGNLPHATNNAERYGWPFLLIPYGPNIDAYRNGAGPATYRRSIYIQGNPYFCPSSKLFNSSGVFTQDLYVSYGYNTGGVGGLQRENNGWFAGQLKKALPSPPAKTLMMIDNDYPTRSAGNEGWYIAYPFITLNHNRHGRGRLTRSGYGNVLFADGHVVTRTDAQMQAVAINYIESNNPPIPASMDKEPWYGRNYLSSKQSIY